MGNSGMKQRYETATKTGTLKISEQKLREMPEEVLSLTDNLRVLDLSKNKLALLPDDISMLKNLKQLNVESNRLQKLPSSLINIRKLEVLNASSNLLTQVPQSLCSLINLKQLFLNHNNFEVFPQEVFGLRNLDVLEITHNKITRIPSGMSQLFVTELNLSQNEISYISDDLHLAPRLKILKLEENCLSLEAIQPCLLRDSRIHTINLDGNLFEPKHLALIEGYNEYIQRYTAMKKKMF